MMDELEKLGGLPHAKQVGNYLDQLDTNASDILNAMIARLESQQAELKAANEPTSCGHARKFRIEDGSDSCLICTHKSFTNMERAFNQKIGIMQAELKALRELIEHCWIHDGYPDCGFLEMTSGQKILYLKLTHREDEAKARECEKLGEK